MSDTGLRLPTASTRDAWRMVRELLRPRRFAAVGTLVLLTTASGVALFAPPLVGWIVDLVVDGEPPSALTRPALLLLLVALGQGLFGTLGSMSVARVGEGALAELRERVVERALQLPLERIERGGTGDLVARVSGDVAVLATVTRTVVPALTGAALTVGLTFVGLAALDWRFALAGLIAAPIQLNALRWYLQRSGPVYAAERIAEGARSQQLLDSMGGVETVQAFGLADRHVGAVTRTSQQAVDLANRAARMASIFFGRLNYAEFVGMAAILTAGFWMVGSGAATIGTATAAALYFHRLFDPINILLALFDEAQQGLAGLARLVGVIRTPLPTGPERPGVPADGSIAVDLVGFGYAPDSVAVDDVSLTVADGEHVALVGASGAGKTTLAKLIAGVHPARTGRVLVGGVDVADIEPARLRASVALVSQETHVFAGTLADDLRLAAPDASDAALTEALHRVGAGGWLGRLPDGLATAVGEGGVPLTAAAAQQLALARLILVRPRVAILDEATADAGSAGARTLDAAAVEAIRGRTALIVAHRLSQAVTADRIVVMDAGRIVEIGTHEALLAADGSYAALWASWSRARIG